MAQDSTSFEDILKMPSDSFERPKQVPPGTYFAMIPSMPEHGTIQSGTPFSRYTWRLLQADKDVDEDALNACLTKPDGTVMPLREKSVQQMFWNTLEAGYRHREFLTALGIPENDGELLEDRIAQVPGKEAWIKLVLRPDRTRKDVMYLTVTEVIAASDKD